MGNQVSNFLPVTGKVILLDGTIKEFEHPIIVAEMMLECPQQVVVDLNSSSNNTQKRLSPLPADKVLEVGRIYLMVPIRRGKPAHLSPQEAHHILLRVNSMLRSKSLVNNSNKFLPLFAKICPANNNIEDKNCKFVVSKKEVDEDGLDDVVDQKLDYLSRQVSGKGWKPSLDTIEEKKDEIKKVSNWVLVAKRVHNKGLIWG
ncbi:uncharacterized protein LOC130798207 [Amaranthus tricolor]|uniref:uncharacterized protein LOC130798207 n=1 Tax=Amaranthus tricolor TaxID=29722 RepID=UPI0025876D2F|nr:uncharacterized protein LOC130798207 [Amaranthus tricolor]